MRAPKRYEAKDGAVTWKVRFRLDGRETSETFDTEPDAERFARLLDVLGDAHAALTQFYGSDHAGDGVTVDDIAELFFAWKADKVRSDRTVADYRRDYRNWIKPPFGARLAALVTEVDVQKWVDTMATGRDWLNGEGVNPSPLGGMLSPKSVADRHAVLFGIYQWAMHPGRRFVEHNPAVGTALPKRRKRTPKGLRPAEWQALYAALQQITPAGADLALFLLSTGWRWSEAVALDADQVEDYGDALFVTMAQVSRRNAAGQHVIVDDGKSRAAERRIRLDAEASEMLRRRLDAIRHRGLVLTNPQGNKWHYSNYRTRVWLPAIRVANLTRRPTVHWLRHTHVGWLIIAGGASLPEIQRRIGHESIDTTIGVYGRMVDDITEDALGRFAAFREQGQPAARGGETQRRAAIEES